MKDLVDKDGKVYERDNLILLGGGSNSYTFSYDDGDMKKVIKLFKRGCLDFALNPYVAGIIKLLPLKSYPNFYSILEQGGEYLGYVMEYFERCDNLLLDMTKDSLITSFQAMEEDVSSFSRGHLLMSDVRSYNLLFSSDGLAHLVDYDMYAEDWLLRAKKTYYYWRVYDEVTIKANEERPWIFVPAYFSLCNTEAFMENSGSLTSQLNDYLLQVISGSKDLDLTLDTFMSDQRNSGLEEVRTELQSWYDVNYGNV